MGDSTTLKDYHGAQLKKPRKETLRFILDYSKSLKVEKLKSGMEIDLIQN